MNNDQTPRQAEGACVIVMPSNNTGILTGYLAGRYPGLLGHLFSPGGEKGPFPFMPYALDNGVFGSGEGWKPEPWRKMLEWAAQSGQAPRWALVPDAVGNRDLTLSRWDMFAKITASYGWPMAFAAQDGMTFDDVPKEASVVFLGGSTEWKRDAITPWCARFRRVHVGRINTYRWLRVCEDAGAESVDGTGWMRGDKEQLRGLQTWLSESIGESARTTQMCMSFADTDEQTELGSKWCRINEAASCGDAK